jgi:hypothetical protein
VAVNAESAPPSHPRQLEASESAQRFRTALVSRRRFLWVGDRGGDPQPQVAAACSTGGDGSDRDALSSAAEKGDASMAADSADHERVRGGIVLRRIRAQARGALAPDPRGRTPRRPSTDHAPGVHRRSHSPPAAPSGATYWCRCRWSFRALPGGDLRRRTHRPAPAHTGDGHDNGSCTGHGWGNHSGKWRGRGPLSSRPHRRRSGRSRFP